GTSGASAATDSTVSRRLVRGSASNQVSRATPTGPLGRYTCRGNRGRPARTAKVTGTEAPNRSAPVSSTAVMTRFAAYASAGNETSGATRTLNRAGSSAEGPTVTAGTAGSALSPTPLPATCAPAPPPPPPPRLH